MAQGKYVLRDQADIESLNDDKFMDEWTALGEAQQDIKAQLTLFSAEHQRREEQARLAERLGPLSDSEREALTQYVEAQGAEAQAEVGAV